MKIPHRVLDSCFVIAFFMLFGFPNINAMYQADLASSFGVPCQSADFPFLKFNESLVFPQDESLNRPEDGKALPDGRVVVGDERSGLRIIERNGKSRPFGKFKEDRFQIGAQPKNPAAPNGVFLETDGRHLLMTDVYAGKIYRIDTRTEAVEMIYKHEYGINSVIRDRKGNVWFTQSTKNPPDNFMALYDSINRPKPDGAVFVLRKSGDGFAKRAETVAADIYFANGLTLNNSETKMFVAETMMDRILVFDVDPVKLTLSGRKTYAYVLTPDNLAVDSRDNLVAASPLSNSVIAVDRKCKSTHTIFSAPSPENSAAQNKWVVNSNLGKPLLSLVTPESAKPLPGLITGMFWSTDHKTLYVSGLGKAIVKIEMRK